MISGPDTIADSKLVYIKRCIAETINNPQFTILIKNIFKGVKRNNVVQYLWKYQNNLRYVPENGGSDYCKDGVELLKSKFGDCEDFTVFNAAIFKLYGVRYRIKVTDTFCSGYFTHILVQYYDNSRMSWISFDGTYRIKGIGGEPSHCKERFYY